MREHSEVDAEGHEQQRVGGDLPPDQGPLIVEGPGEGDQVDDPSGVPCPGVERQLEQDHPHQEQQVDPQQREENGFRPVPGQIRLVVQAHAFSEGQAV